MRQEIREKLISMSESKYRDFSSALVPNCRTMLGVRLPLLRKYAKELSEKGTVVLDDEKDIYFEETMLRGMIIGSLKIDFEQRLEYIRNFVPIIDCWSVCDSFCSSLKFVNKNKKMVWDFLQEYINSDKEFFIRFGVVMLRGYFIDEEYIDRTLNAISNARTENFYASMGVAWALCDCYVKFPERTKKVLLENRIDRETYKRTVRKICDSYRISRSEKDFLKNTLK